MQNAGRNRKVNGRYCEIIVLVAWRAATNNADLFDWTNETVHKVESAARSASLVIMQLLVGV